MERLSLTSRASYNAIEAAIHMARYQLAAPYCKERRILDVACGEGYGAYTLKQLGAASVQGVDNSPQAISRAESLFSRHGIQFFLHEAEYVDALFPNQGFDVIVSLETIEHVRDPKRFLQAIRNLASDQSTIIITCPNDYWYYPSAEQSNPYHRKKYSFEEFRELTTSVLGDQAAWGFGVPLIGFGTVTEDSITGKDPLLGQVAMLDFNQQASAIVVPPGLSARIGPRNCSYFAGIWGGNGTRIYSSAVAPISMDQYSNLMSLGPSAPEKQKREREQDMEHRLETAHCEREYYRIQSLALGKELDILNEQYDQLRGVLDQSVLSQNRIPQIDHISRPVSSNRTGKLSTPVNPDRFRNLILRGARRVRPYLPKPCLTVAQRIARALGL